MNMAAHSTRSYLPAIALCVSLLLLGALYGSSLMELWEAAQGRTPPSWPSWALGADAGLVATALAHAALTARSLWPWAPCERSGNVPRRWSGRWSAGWLLLSALALTGALVIGRVALELPVGPSTITFGIGALLLGVGAATVALRQLRAAEPARTGASGSASSLESRKEHR